MKDNPKVRAAFFHAGSHLEEKFIEAENIETVRDLIEGHEKALIACHKLKIGKKTYSVIHDVYKKRDINYNSETIPSVTNDNYGTIFFGNVIICNAGKNCFLSLTKEDFKNIQSHIGFLIGSDMSSTFLFPAIRTNDETLKRDF